jgi:hypothetical protein
MLKLSIAALLFSTAAASAQIAPKECVRPVVGKSGAVLYCTRDLSMDPADPACTCRAIVASGGGGGGWSPAAPIDPVDPVDPIDPEDPEDPVDPEDPGEDDPVDPPEDDDDTKPGWGHGDDNHDHSGPPGLDKPKNPKSPKA